MRALLVLLVACGSNESAAPPPSTPPPPSLAEARAYVIGKGVARDYRKAVALYRTRCAGGCGDREACRQYLDLVFKDRGAVLGRPDLGVVGLLCDRGDQLACLVASLYGTRPQPPHDLSAETLCRAGDHLACQLVLGDLHFGPYEGEPRPPTRVHPVIVQSCLEGVESSCGQLSGGDDPIAVMAHAQQVTLCDAGEADACDQVPGREISKEELCRAGDYDACSGSLVDGDRARACAAGYGKACTPPRETGLYGELQRTHELVPTPRCN